MDKKHETGVATRKLVGVFVLKKNASWNTTDVETEKLFCLSIGIFSRYDRFDHELFSVLW